MSHVAIITCLQVLGIEYCGRFIDAALSIQAGNDVSGFSLELSLEPKVHSQRVVFKQVLFKETVNIYFRNLRMFWCYLYITYLVQL